MTSRLFAIDIHVNALMAEFLLIQYSDLHCAQVNAVILVLPEITPRYYQNASQ